jgi:transcriptional regulator with XRE-family HTH domain
MGCQQGELEEKLERIRQAVPETLRWLEKVDPMLGPQIAGARWTQDDLARALGTTQQIVSGNERPGKINSFASGVALLGLAVSEGNLDLADAALDGTEYCLILQNELREPRGDLSVELGFLARRVGEILAHGLDALRDGRIDAAERRQLRDDIRRLFRILEEIESVLELKPSPRTKTTTPKRRR